MRPLRLSVCWLNNWLDLLPVLLNTIMERFCKPLNIYSSAMC